LDAAAFLIQSKNVSRLRVEPAALHPGVERFGVVANESNVVHARTYRGRVESRKAGRCLGVKFRFFRGLARGAPLFYAPRQED